MLTKSILHTSIRIDDIDDVYIKLTVFQGLTWSNSINLQKLHRTKSGELIVNTFIAPEFISGFPGLVHVFLSKKSRHYIKNNMLSQQKLLKLLEKYSDENLPKEGDSIRVSVEDVVNDGNSIQGPINVIMGTVLHIGNDHVLIKTVHHDNLIFAFDYFKMNYREYLDIHKAKQLAQ